MGGKGAKRRPSKNNKGPKKGNGGDKKKKGNRRSGAGSSGRRSGGRSAKSRCTGDIFSEAAMDNAYYVCHNIQDVLKIRGFPWPDAQKKKKKGKGKK